MGMSLYTYLGYGFCIYNDDSLDNKPLPWMKQEENDDNYDDEDYPTEYIHYYLSKKGYDLDILEWKEQSKLEKDIGISIIEMGTCDFTTFYLTVTDSLKEGEWGGSKIELPESAHQKVSWDKKLQDFCAFVGIEYEQPSWVLGCYYSY